MKYKLMLFLCIVTAIILGAYLGGLCADSTAPYINWLGFSKSFGFDTISMDLAVLKFDLGLHFDLNVMQLLFILIAVVVAPKLADKIKTK